jgi:hypothetical protein
MGSGFGRQEKKAVNSSGLNYKLHALTVMLIEPYQIFRASLFPISRGMILAYIRATRDGQKSAFLEARKINVWIPQCLIKGCNFSINSRDPLLSATLISALHRCFTVLDKFHNRVHTLEPNLGRQGLPGPKLYRRNWNIRYHCLTACETFNASLLDTKVLIGNILKWSKDEYNS